MEDNVTFLGTTQHPDTGERVWVLPADCPHGVDAAIKVVDACLSTADTSEWAVAAWLTQEELEIGAVDTLAGLMSLLAGLTALLAPSDQDPVDRLLAYMGDRFPSTWPTALTWAAEAGSRYLHPRFVPFRLSVPELVAIITALAVISGDTDV